MWVGYDNVMVSVLLKMYLFLKNIMVWSALSFLNDNTDFDLTCPLFYLRTAEDYLNFELGILFCLNIEY